MRRVSFVVYSGNSGDDSFRNDTALRVNATGGAGSDRLTGGSNSDRLRGDAGVDVVNGGIGNDTCDAESESACEADIPPPPRIRIPT